MRPLGSTLLLALVTSVAGAQPADLPRSTPEAQGIPSAAVFALVEQAEETVDALHSLMVLRHGHVVAEGWWAPYRREDPHVLFSLSKSFASTGIGLAAAEGRLSIDDPVISFFPGEAPAAPSANLKAMRVRDLLSMSTGHHAEVIERFPYVDPDVSQTRAFLALPVAHKPGTHFVYNTPASYMLSAIVQQVTGTTLLDYLRPRLFEPLGIGAPRWDATPHGVSLGGFGLSVRTEDVARFGQLYLQRGTWNGRRLLPEDWVEAATARQVSNGSNPESDWDQGYGYQFWRARHGAYRGDGAFGQYCIVMPKLDAVVVFTAGTRDMPAIQDLVWRHLLPAMQPNPLPDDPGGHARLTQKLAGLVLAPPAGAHASRAEQRVANRTYEFPKNDGGIDALRVEFGTAPALTIRVGGRDHRVPFGRGTWARGGTLRAWDSPLPVTAGQPVAASGAWTDEDTLDVKACFYETPFCETLRLRFAGDALVLDQSMNVGFGPTTRPTIVGLPPRAAGRGPGRP
jgi:CubicO group peptidase (beta-lactamase class C family)